MLRAPVSSPQSEENWALSLGWSPDHKKIVGLVLGYREPDIEFLTQIASRSESYGHALYTPLLLIEAVLWRDSIELRNHGQELIDVETKTRFFNWSETASTTGRTDIDIDSFTKSLNRILSRLSVYEMKMKGTHISLDRIADCFKKTHKAEGQDTHDFSDRIARLHEDIDSLLQTVYLNQRVASSQVQVVHKLLLLRLKDTLTIKRCIPCCHSVTTDLAGR